MWGRLLTKAALLLAAVVGPAAMANEPGTETNERSKITNGNVAQPPTTAERPKADLSTNPNPQAVRNPRVVLITSKDSEQCRHELERLTKPGGAFAAMQSQGWKIGAGADNHLQLVDHKEVPQLVE